MSFYPKDSRRRFYLSLLLVFSLFLVSTTRGEDDGDGKGRAPVPVIFDTDIGFDVDDALALGMIHALADRGELNLLAIVSTNGHPIVDPYLRTLNAYYGRPGIPIGIGLSSPNRGEGVYMGKVLDRFADEWGVELPADGDYENLPVKESAEVFRKALADAEDHSVVILTSGFTTNLAELLDTLADDLSPLTGRELVEKKVDRLILVGGAFAEGFESHVENNIRWDLPAALRLVDEWPTPILWSGYEIGVQLVVAISEFDQDLSEKFFDSPIALSYRTYAGVNSYNRLALWDLTLPLLAARPDRYFSTSGTGRVTIREDGTTFFAPDAPDSSQGDAEGASGAEGTGRDRIVFPLTPEQVVVASEILRALVSEPPVSRK